MTHLTDADRSSSPTHSAFARFITLPARRPVTTLLIAALLAVASFLAVLRLHPDARLERMFSQHDPAAAALVRVLDQFSAAEELLLLVTLPDDQRHADVPRLIGFAERLDAAIHASPEASSMADGVMYRADADMRQ